MRGSSPRMTALLESVITGLDPAISRRALALLSAAVAVPRLRLMPTLAGRATAVLTIAILAIAILAIPALTVTALTIARPRLALLAVAVVALAALCLSVFAAAVAAVAGTSALSPAAAMTIGMAI